MIYGYMYKMNFYKNRLEAATTLIWNGFRITGILVN